MKGQNQITAGWLWRLGSMLALAGLVYGCAAPASAPSSAPASPQTSPAGAASVEESPAATPSASTAGQASAPAAAEPSQAAASTPAAAESSQAAASPSPSVAPAGDEASAGASATAEASPGASPVGTASASPTPEAAARFTVGEIDGQPVLLLNLKVSFEWRLGSETVADSMQQALCSEAAPGAATFYQDFEDGLEQAAEYVYLYTNGQMSLGQVDVYSDGQAWEDADIRVLANASYRATAYLGGVVDQPWEYQRPPAPAVSAAGSPAASVAEPGSLTFYPGAIYLGRLWNGLGSRCGPWSNPLGWRTLGHELAHYALFLHDQYYNVSDGHPITCDTELETMISALASAAAAAGAPALPSARADKDPGTATLMSYHYQANALSNALDLQCADSPQRVVHRNTDIPAFQRALSQYLAVLPSGSITLPPVNAAIDVADAAGTLRIVQRFGAPSAPPSAFRIQCSRGGACSAVPAGAASSCLTAGDSYVLKNPAASDFAQRVVGQGYLIYGGPPGAQSGTAAVVGLDPTDNVQVFTQDPVSGDFEVANVSHTLASASASSVMSQVAAWCPEITLDPSIDPGPVATRAGDPAIRGFTVRVVNKRPNPSIVGLRIAYCPAGMPCQEVSTDNNLLHVLRPGEQAAVHAFNGETTVPLALGEPFAAAHGYFLVRALDGNGGTIGDAIIWYQLGGGLGPATIQGHPPLVDGKVRVDLLQNDLQQIPGDTRVLYSRYWTCQPLPAGAFELPIYVQVKAGNQPWDAVAPPDSSLLVQLGYDADVLAANGVDLNGIENRLLINRSFGDQQEWRPVDGAIVDTRLHSIAVVIKDFNPQGEVFVVSLAP